MSINRRDFLGLAALGSVTCLVGRTEASDGTGLIDSGQAYGVLVDTVLCIGCRKCEWACSREYQLSNAPPAWFDNKLVFDEHRRPDANAYTVVNRFHNPDDGKAYMMKVQCMHCNDPACVSACIVGAMQKSSIGPVIYDAWKCIGCRYCMIACPFQVPAYEYDRPLEPRVRKCSFCYERLAAGNLMPACVSICPNESLAFGKRKDLIEIARTRIKRSPEQYTNHIYGEHEVGGTSWMYLAGVDFIHTELPKLDSEPIPPYTERIQHGIFKAFIPPLALYGLLGLIMRSLHEEKDKGRADNE